MDKPKINAFIQTPMKYKASFSRENLITLHVKITMFSSHVKRSSLLWVDNNSRFWSKKTAKKGNTLAPHCCLFETEYYMAAWRYEISRPEES